MQKWEYESHTWKRAAGSTPISEEKMQQWLDDAGPKGWELVAAIPVSNSEGGLTHEIRLYFKRPANPEQS